MADPTQIIQALHSEIDALDNAADTETLDPAEWVQLAQDATQLVRDIAIVRDRIHTHAGEALGRYESTIDGIGVVRRHRAKSRTGWDNDDLYRRVLDSRVVDDVSGEVLSQVDVVKRVYACKGYQARIGELRKLGIDIDEFCQTEDRGWKVQVI